MGVLSDAEVIERIFAHIDNGTTDTGEDIWHEPTSNYMDADRFAEELRLLRHLPTPYCPSAALTADGDYLARTVGGVPVIVVRDRDGQLKGFRNACRHRGVSLVEGSGCAKVFTCTYHGWAYGLDGKLQHVPHEHGFPGLDRDSHGLVPIHSVIERQGIVFVCVDEPVGDGALGDLPQCFDPGQQVFDVSEGDTEVNWKLNIEATLEGYHIKFTHPETFYPYGYDNLTVVETFGANSRVTFPFRRIEKIRHLPPASRQIDGMATYAYNIFPNATLAMLSNHTTLSISEPLTPTCTRFHTFRLGNRGMTDSSEDRARLNKDASFVADTGLKEDNDVIRRIQLGLASGANSHFLYGKFEQAIVHFHRKLAEGLSSLSQLE